MVQLKNVLYNKFIDSHLWFIFLHNYQLLDEVEQNIVICRWRADQLFADAEGRGK